MSPSMTPEVILYLMKELRFLNVNHHSNFVSNWLKKLMCFKEFS